MFLEQLKLFRMPEPPPATPARHLLVGGRIVEYRLKSGMRRLSMTIDERGLRINAPARMPREEIHAFVAQHGEWVLQKLDELAHVARRRHLTVKDGLRLPLLDGEAELRVLPGANRVRWVGDMLVLEARPGAELAPLARRGLQRRALSHFGPSLVHHAARLGRPAPALALSSAHTRWGSCSGDTIRINWRLIHLPAHLGDYVVAHEVAHLVEINHGKRFWAIVATLCPEWRAARDELKRRAASLPIL